MSKSDKPTKAEKKKHTDFLVAHGVDSNVAKQVTKEDDDNATKEDVGVSISNYVKTLKKVKK